MTTIEADRVSTHGPPRDTDWAPGHRDGLLDIVMRQAFDGRTSVRRLHQRFPLRTTVPLYLDPQDPGMAFVYAQNPTGGVFEGDRLHTAVEVEAGARVHLTTQSATKIFRMTTDHAVQDYQFRIGENGLLEHIPDMIIPHADARLRQHVSVELGAGAVYVGAEILAPGRTARGERFTYHSLHLATTLHHEGREVCTDAVRLDPHQSDPTAPGLLGEYDYLVALLVAAPGRQLDPVEFDVVAATAAGSDGVGGAGALPNDAGVSVRILTRDSRSAVAAARLAWEHARAVLLERPLPRIRK